MKNRIITILLIPGSLFLSLILLELVFHLPLKANHEYFDFWMLPNKIFYLDENGNKVYFDKIGKMDFNKIDILTIQYDQNHRYINKRNKSDFNILFVGDSVTYGSGVDNPKKIFTYLLEEKLNKYYHKKIDVINLAFGGYELSDINVLIKTQVLGYNPNLIVYGYFQNDLQCSSLIPTYLPYLRYRYSNNLIHRLRVYYLIEDKIQKIKDKLRIKYHLFGCEIDKKTAYKKLDEIFNFTKNNNISLYIINFPYIKEDYPSDSFIKLYCKERNCTYLDLREEFIERSVPYKQIRGYYKGHPEGDSIHYNIDGHKLIADILYTDLSEKNLIPSNRSNTN